MAGIPPPPPAFTVFDAMVQCGVDNVNLFNGDTAAERMAADIFGDNFSSCMDKTVEELHHDFKSYSELTQAQGQIRLTPGTKRYMKSFIQWV